MHHFDLLLDMELITYRACKETLQKIEAQKSLEASLGGIDKLYVEMKELAVVNSIADELERITQLQN